MTENTFRTILFIALLLVAPAILFLVQVVFIVPPVVLLAGLVYLLKKIAAGGLGLDNLTFLAFLLIHLAIFGGMYWLLAWVFGKLARLLAPGLPRCIFLGLLLAGLACLSQLPIYGGAGHGPARLGPLQTLLAALTRSYGDHSALILSLTAGTLVAAAAIWTIRRRRRQGPPPAP